MSITFDPVKSSLLNTRINYLEKVNLKDPKLFNSSAFLSVLAILGFKHTFELQVNPPVSVSSL